MVIKNGAQELYFRRGMLLRELPPDVKDNGINFFFPDGKEVHISCGSRKNAERIWNQLQETLWQKAKRVFRKNSGTQR